MQYINNIEYIYDLFLYIHKQVLLSIIIKQEYFFKNKMQFSNSLLIWPTRLSTTWISQARGSLVYLTTTAILPSNLCHMLSNSIKNAQLLQSSKSILYNKHYLLYNKHYYMYYLGNYNPLVRIAIALLFTNYYTIKTNKCNIFNTTHRTMYH